MQAVFAFVSQVLYWGLTLYEWIIIIAILLSWVTPDPNNPVVVFLNRMTVPFWNWLRAFLPRQITLFAPYVSLLVVWFLKIFLPGTTGAMGGWIGGVVPAGTFMVQVAGFFLLGLGVVLQNFLFFLIILLIIWFVLTLVSPSVTNPIVRTIYFLVDPFITPVQRWLPRSRFDFSPLVVAFIFLLINVVLVSPLLNYAAGLADLGRYTLPGARVL